MSDLATDHAIARIADRQHSVIHHRQLITCGVDRHTIGRRRRRGLLRTVFPHVYLLGAGNLPAHALEQAAVLACGDTATVSSLRSLAIWKIREAQPAEPVDVTVIGRQAPRYDGIRLHRVARLAREDRTTRHGLPVTRPARALLESAALLPLRELERAIGEALGLKLVTRQGLLAVCKRYPRHRGTAIIRELADPGRASEITESEAEERFHALLQTADIAPSVTQHWLDGRFRADRAWPELKLIVEIDGLRWHRERVEADARRQHYLEDHGWVVLRFTRRQVVQEPEFVAYRLGVAIGRARERLTAGAYGAGGAAAAA